MTDRDSLEPPAALEQRVVGTLRARGLLRTPAAGPSRKRRRVWVWPAAIAAGLLLFVGGFALGRRPAAPPADGLGRYTLLLYEGPEFNPGPSEEPALVREYSAWAGELAARGQLVAGEKLGSQAWTLGDRTSAGPAGPTGFFVIAARSHDEALAIARTCPHLRYGGTVSVRPIEAT
jgi:hypothetical protein